MAVPSSKAKKKEEVDDDKKKKKKRRLSRGSSKSVSSGGSGGGTGGNGRGNNGKGEGPLTSAWLRRQKQQQQQEENDDEGKKRQQQDSKAKKKRGSSSPPKQKRKNAGGDSGVSKSAQRRRRREAAELEEERRLLASALFGVGGTGGVGSGGTSMSGGSLLTDGSISGRRQQQRNEQSAKVTKGRKEGEDDEGDDEYDNDDDDDDADEPDDDEVEEEPFLFEIDRVGSTKEVVVADNEDDDHDDAEKEPSRGVEGDDAAAAAAADAAESEEEERESRNRTGGVGVGVGVGGRKRRQGEQDAYSDDDDSGSEDVERQHDDGGGNGGAAWVDEDDEALAVNIMGGNNNNKKKTRRMRGRRMVVVGGRKSLRKLRRSMEESVLTGDQVESRLRERYVDTMHATARTDWAKIGSKNKNDSKKGDDETRMIADESAPLLLGSAGGIGGGGGASRLAPHAIEMLRCPDANQSDPNAAAVQAVHFHPGSDDDPDRPLLLTAGLDKTLRFFRVNGGEDGKSVKVHGIHFPKLPIYSASFLGNRGNVVISGRRPFFYLYNAEAERLDTIPRILGRPERSLEFCVPSPNGRTIAFGGNDGYILLYDTHNKSLMGTLKMNGSVRSMAFTTSAGGGQQDEELLSSGSDGDVYRWHLGSRKCIERFSNNDGTVTRSLAVSSDHHVAVGADSGVVNLYENNGNNMMYRQQQRQQQPQQPPNLVKSVMNVKTPVDGLKFNHDGQILAMCSRRDRDQGSLKLLHVPTATVFSNWPTSKTPLSYVWSLDFSPRSKYMAVGNDKGKCLLYRIQHYYNNQQE